MDSPSPVAILNELLASEERGLPVRVLESTVFVSNLSAGDSALVQSMAVAQRENQESLCKAVMNCGGTPGPRSADATSGDMHFQDIRCLMPRLAADREAIIAKYAAAADRVSDLPDVGGLLAQIAASHREELAMLTPSVDPSSVPAS